MKPKPTLTPFITVSRGSNPVEVATLAFNGDVALIELTHIAWKTSTNSMETRYHWRVMHMTNSQGDIFNRQLVDETPVVARMGVTEPVYTNQSFPKVTYQMLARREAVEAAKSFLRIKTELRIVGDPGDKDEEDSEENAA
jgi:hypothetical protein